MPIVLVRSNLASSYSHKYPWRVLVSGLLGNSCRSLQFAQAGSLLVLYCLMYLIFSIFIIYHPILYFLYLIVFVNTCLLTLFIIYWKYLCVLLLYIFIHEQKIIFVLHISFVINRMFARETYLFSRYFYRVFSELLRYIF